MNSRARLEALSDRYRVERELGAGGMATVYLAHDVKHDRKVALKVLKPELSAVLGAERFLAEIKTTANLQHPHILPLHDSGEVEGTVFYVMPFVEGESLRDRLNRERQLPIADAVRIATEIASALDYAHRRGVIHRDIKPENILLHDGQALIADFGIALAASRTDGGTRITETGMSLGTPHYMSPEQAMGERSLDARTDIYALGCVLYEMLAGEPPHSGPTAQAIVAKVLTDEPRPLAQLRKTVPLNVAAATEKALAKLPADRFENAKQFADALGNPAFAGTGAGGGRHMDPAAQRWQNRALVPLAVVAVVASILAVWGWLRPTPPRPVARYYLALPDSAQVAGNFARIAITPDGSRLVYRSGPTIENTALWVRDRDKMIGRRLAQTGDHGARTPFVSPDGGTVAYLANRAVWTVPLNGGTPTRLSAGAIGEYGGSWSRDGVIYVDGDGPSGLMKVRALPGSAPEPFTRLDAERGESDHVFPEVLPRGNGVLFVVRIGSFDRWEIAVADVETGSHRVLTNGVYVRYAKSGHLLVVSATGTLSAIRFDDRALKLVGETVALDEQVGLRGAVRVPDIVVTDHGTLIYATGDISLSGARGEPMWVERDGKATPVAAGWTTSARFPALSPDGSQLALSIHEASGSLNLWVRELVRGTTTKLTHDGDLNFRPSWFADSKSLLYMSNRRRLGETYVRRLDGSDRDSLVLARRAEISEVFITRDSQWIVYREGANTNADLYARRFRGDTTPVPLATSNFLEREPAVSPNGRFLVYTSNETGRNEIYIRPFPNVNTGKWLVSTAGGINPLWSHDGKELFYRNTNGDLVAVSVTDNGSPPLGQQRVLFSALPYTFEPTHRAYDVAPDGRRFIMIRQVAEATALNTPLVVVENFFEELRRSLPR